MTGQVLCSGSEVESRVIGNISTVNSIYKENIMQAKIDYEAKLQELQLREEELNIREAALDEERLALKEEQNSMEAARGEYMEEKLMYKSLNEDLMTQKATLIDLCQQIRFEHDLD